jgi:hypothetical protein
MKRTLLAAAAAVALTGVSSDVSAQWVTHQVFHTPAPVVFAQSPVWVAPAPVVTYRPVVVAPHPRVVRTYSPVVTTRHRPFLGGSVQRVRYAPRSVVVW